eukprot:6455125-Lingulodinium_polyedra.AAC.1
MHVASVVALQRAPARISEHARRKPFGHAFELVLRRRSGSRDAFLTVHARGAARCRVRGVSEMRVGVASRCGAR